MKSSLLLVLAVGFLFGLPGIVFARGVSIFSYQELLDKSDLVVLATPTATNDTKERNKLVGQPVVGVETKFSVSAVLKGDKALKDFVLHHYRSGGAGMVPDGPGLLSFVPVDGTTVLGRAYIQFLVREPDGRFAPVVGQLDPQFAIRELR